MLLFLGDHHHGERVEVHRVLSQALHLQRAERGLQRTLVAVLLAGLVRLL